MTAGNTFNKETDPMLPLIRNKWSIVNVYDLSFKQLTFTTYTFVHRILSPIGHRLQGFPFTLICLEPCSQSVLKSASALLLCPFPSFLTFSTLTTSITFNLSPLSMGQQEMITLFTGATFSYPTRDYLITLCFYGLLTFSLL